MDRRKMLKREREKMSKEKNLKKNREIYRGFYWILDEFR